MKKYSVLRIGLVLSFTLLLFACGGGGGSESSNNAAPGETVINGRA